MNNSQSHHRAHDDDDVDDALQQKLSHFLLSLPSDPAPFCVCPLGEFALLHGDMTEEAVWTQTHTQTDYHYMFP